MMWFANDFHSWLHHSWKSLANHLTHHQKIVIHSNSCIILYKSTRILLGCFADLITKLFGNIKTIDSMCPARSSGCMTMSLFSQYCPQELRQSQQIGSGLLILPVIQFVNKIIRIINQWNENSKENIAKHYLAFDKMTNLQQIIK